MTYIANSNRLPSYPLLPLHAYSVVGRLSHRSVIIGLEVVSTEVELQGEAYHKFVWKEVVFQEGREEVSSH